MTNLHSIDDIHKLCNEIDKLGRFALDLEFIPERTYEPEICLVQIATDNDAYIIDPFEVKDLSYLWQRVADPNILVVLHSGDQDLDLIHQSCKLIPQNIADTQIAAGFIGFGYPIGYGKLLSQLLNISISKTESYTDWAKRPLSKSQMDYAINDVKHLLSLYDKILEILDERGRSSWPLDEYKRYENNEFYERDRNRDFLKIKGASSLPRRNLAVLQALCLWRHKEAARINKPLKIVLPDNVLFEFSRHPPKAKEDIQRIRGIRPDQVKQYSQQLLETIKEALLLPEAEWPSWPHSRIPSRKEMLASDFLFTLMKMIIFDLDISPELVSTRSSLEALVRCHFENKIDTNNFPLLTGWRYELVGKHILAVLKGEECKFKIQKKNHPLSIEVNGKRIEH